MEFSKRTYSHGKSDVQREKVHESRGNKRTYQRDHNTRRNSWQSRDQSSTPNEDLRSPCHKQPRFKGQKENSTGNRPTAHDTCPWVGKNGGLDKKGSFKIELTNSEFPPLGFNIIGLTPEPVSKDWGDIVEEEEQASKQRNGQREKSFKFKRRLLLSASDSKEATKNPAKGDKTNPSSKVLQAMITDPHKIAQRQKQIDIGKNTKSYGHYFNTIKRCDRSKDDPWTPDKYQSCSTRSWVGQIKVWRRRLHSYDLSSETKEDLFSTSSASSSQATEDTNMDIEEKSKCSSIKDMFEGFDLDSCLTDDGFPL